jgi:type III pantothenate kinase
MFLVDIGNTRIKWATCINGELSGKGCLVWRTEGLERLFLKEWRPECVPERVVVSNIAGDEIAHRITAWCMNKWRVRPEFPQALGQAYGVRNGYEDPRQLGVDRWLGMIAAWNSHRSACCIADCGTAITIDALAATGEHLGGLIMPGLNLMRRSLADHTHAIQAGRIGRRSLLLARSTDDCITAGSFNAIVACIDRVIEKLRDQLGENTPFIITGGDAQSLMSSLTVDPQHEPDLVLHGLAVVAEADR